MTLKKLIQKHTWSNISSKFSEIYPEAGKNLEGYKVVFEKLVMMKAKRIDMSIVLSIEKDDNEEYIDVSAQYKYPRNEEEKYLQGIELTPWRNWLGMGVNAKTLANFTEQEIIVHCIYEMSYVGFSEEDIQKIGRKL
ncbi:MAG: hypothetical protein CMC13_09905 [Flavobacteriaceae bacterium]|nr:hypothetical protein [Flavobacteriaceae bacterium]|tara:strand:+ start:42781 stop:43191 length:411 start_codon:yes stop_codon:yes gene_type:complete